MDSITPVRDPVGPSLVALLDLFGAHAKALCFPDIDHGTLEGLADEVRDAAAEVTRSEQALAEARAELERRRAALRQRAERGLAYAKIYAQDDTALREQLEGIDLAPASTPPQRKSKRGSRRAPRARRTTVTSTDDAVTELPFEGERAAAVGT